MNSLKRYREKLLMSKAELARKAGLSALTVDGLRRQELRLETKRKIILALGLQLNDRGKFLAMTDRDLNKPGCPFKDQGRL